MELRDRARELTAHNVFTVGYVGNHGYDLQETVNANCIPPPPAAKIYGGGYGGLAHGCSRPAFCDRDPVLQ